MTGSCNLATINGGGGGGPRQFFCGESDLSFGHHRWPLIEKETFAEVLGPRRLTASELRPAQKLGVKYSFPPDGPRGVNWGTKLFLPSF